MFEASTKSYYNPLRTFWPDVSDGDGAAEAIRLGYGACFVVAGLDTIACLLGPRAALVDALIFVALGMFIRRRSRTAAVIAAAYMTLNVIASVIRMPLVGALTIILMVCLLSSVRGTFAYRRLAPAETGPGTGETDAGMPA